MGNRRLGRKRLFAVEKLGQSVELSSGTGIKDAIVSATQHREGSQIVTEIVMDLGTAKATIIGGGADTNAIGVASLPANIAQLTAATFGVVTEVRAICLEAPTGGDTNLDLEVAAGVVNTAGAPGTGVIAELTAVGEDISTVYDANDLADKYLYICNGSGSGSGAMTAGKFVILIYGFVVPDDLV